MKLLFISFFVVYHFYKFDFVQGFKEECGTNEYDPGIVGVNDCVSWAAYTQSTSQNVTDWCQDVNIQTKCCTTCNVIYKRFTECLDDINSNCSFLIKNTATCTPTISDLCPYSCGVCDKLDQPTCDFMSNTTCVKNGRCENVSYFNVTTVKCVCNFGYSGSICDKNELNLGLIIGLSVSIPLAVISVIIFVLIFCCCKDRCRRRCRKTKYANENDTKLQNIGPRKVLTKKIGKNMGATFIYFEDKDGSKYHLQSINPSAQNVIKNKTLNLLQIDENTYHYDDQNGSKYVIKADLTDPSHEYYTINVLNE